MDDNERRILQEKAYALEQMEQTLGWKVLCERLGEDVAKKQRTLLSGGVEDMETYRKNVGWLEGAEFVLRVPALIRERLEE